MTIAGTILKQLGGRRFIVMTGAKSFMGHADALSFQLPSNFATKGINYIKVTLNLMDTYDITFGKIRGTKYAVISTVEGVYVDQLRSMISSTTGLALSL
jgi:hypothetical protein